MQFKLAFSDDGERFVTYQEYHPYTGHLDVDRVFTGNSDGSTVQYGYLRHSLTARYVRIMPQMWSGRIALRADVLGCGEHARTECTSAASFVFENAGSNHVTIDCPANCGNAEFESSRVFGTTKYGMERRRFFIGRTHKFYTTNFGIW